MVGHLTPVEHNQLTVSETVTLDEYAGGYIEMMEFKNSARGQLTALGNKNAMECNLDGIIKDMAIKQKAYGTLASSEMYLETVDHAVNLPRRSVFLHH